MLIFKPNKKKDFWFSHISEIIKATTNLLGTYLPERNLSKVFIGKNCTQVGFKIKIVIK